MVKISHPLVIIVFIKVFLFITLASTSYGAEIVLSWDQNTEEELAGYYVYYGTSSGTYFEDPYKLPKESLVETDGVVSYQFPIDLTPGVTYYFAVTAYDTWGYETDFSNEVQYTLPEGGNDTIPPIGTIVINNNDIVTYSSDVTLTLFATDDDKELGVDGLMTFSNDNQLWSDPEPYATNKLWTLSPGEGIKTVYVTFSDAAGNRMIEPAQDQIIYQDSPTVCGDPQQLQPVYITASSEFLPFYSKDNAVDGNPSTMWSTFLSFFQKDDFITLDMGSIKKISSFHMYASKLFGTDFFPTNFRIEISSDNITWEELYREKGYTSPLQPTYSDNWDFNSLACRYIRLYITKAKTLFLFLKVAQIAEIEVYGCDLMEDIPVMGEQDFLGETEIELTREEKAADPEPDQLPLSTPGKPAVRFK